MQIPQHVRYIIIAFVLVILLLGDRLWTQDQQQYLHVMGWKNHLLIIPPEQKPVLWGTKDAEQAELFLKSILPFGSQPIDPTNITTSDIHRSSFFDGTFLFFPKNIDINTDTLPLSSLESDWWVFENTLVPTNIPHPTQGILFLGGHKPGKSLRTFAQEHQIPLISISETKEFWLQNKGTTWSLYTY